MSRFWHAVAHVVVMGSQVINVSAVPPKYQPLVAGALSFVQLFLALCHQSPKE